MNSSFQIQFFVYIFILKLLGQNLRIFWNIQKPWFNQFSFTSKSSIYIYNISCFHSSVLFNHHDFPPFCQILEAITTTINTLRAETCGIYNLVTKLSLTNFSLETGPCFQWLDPAFEILQRFNPQLHSWQSDVSFHFQFHRSISEMDD